MVTKSFLLTLSFFFEFFPVKQSYIYRIAVRNPVALLPETQHIPGFLCRNRAAPNQRRRSGAYKLITVKMPGRVLVK